MKNQIIRKTESIREKLVNHRRFLHSNAETGFDTDITAKYIFDTLCSVGAECSFLQKNTVKAEIKGKNEGKTILLRADIDALPIHENTNLDFSSTNGNMHACGHDMHSSMLLGATEVLLSMREHLAGNIRLLFQPAEETLGGAKCAIENGVLEGVDMAMTVHVMTASDIHTGSVILSYDTPCAPSADFFEIIVKGTSCHGSSPSTGVDPVLCACRIATALEHIRAYEVGIHQKAVLTIGEIHAGTGANIIPEQAILRGTLRCFDEETRNLCKTRLEEITKGIAAGFRCRCEIKYTSSCPPLINDKIILEKTSENLKELLGKDNVFKVRNTHSKVQGSEDFAYISNEVPSVTVAIAAGSTKDGYCLPLHNPGVCFDERALEVGCNVFSYNAFCLLK